MRSHPFSMTPIRHFYRLLSLLCLCAFSNAANLCAAVAVDGDDASRYNHPVLTPQIGHTGPSSLYACYSPDASLIVTTGTDNVAKIWDARTGLILRTLRGRTPFNFAAFSPDSRRIVTAGCDRAAIIWETQTGRILRILIGHTGVVNCACFSPDGKYILTASDDKTAKIWDAKTGNLWKTLVGHAGSVSLASFSPNGKLIVTASFDNTTRLWDAETGGLLRSFENSGSRTYAASFSADSARLTTANGDRTCRIWDTRTGRLLHAIAWPKMPSFDPVPGNNPTEARSKTMFPPAPGIKTTITAASFSRDGVSIALAYTTIHGSPDTSDTVGRTCQIWDPATGQIRSTITGQTPSQFNLSPFNSVDFAPNGKTLITSDSSVSADLWDVKTGTWDVKTGTWDVKTGTWDVKTGTWDVKTGTWAVKTGTWDVKTGTWDVKTGTWDVKTGTWDVKTGTWDVKTGTWDVKTGTPFGRLKSYADSISELAISGDGSLYMDVDDVYKWNLITGQLQKHSSFSDISADGRRTVDNALQEGTMLKMKVYDAKTGSVVQTLQLPVSEGDIYSTSISPDGTQVVIAQGHQGDGASQGHYGDGTHGMSCGLWDVQTGLRLRSLGRENEEYGINFAKFSPDGQSILTSKMQGRGVQVWDSKTGKLRFVFGTTYAFHSAAFSPDGSRIVTGGANMKGGATGTITVWNAETGALMQTLTGHKGVVVSVSFSQDSKRIVAAMDDHSTEVWNTETGQLMHTTWEEETAITPLHIERYGGTIDGAFTAFFSPDRTRIVSAYGNGMAHVLDAQTGKTLCTFLPFNDRTWAVTDPEGRYDSSNGGDVKGLHWVVGNEPIALSQLRDRYYEPGLLAKVMGFDKTPLRDVEAFDHVKLYPEVTMAADPSGAANRIAVHLAERGGGIGRVQVYVNDVLFQEDARPAAAIARGLDFAAGSAGSKTLDFTVDLSAAPTLRPGGLAANKVGVIAYNGENWLPSRSVELLTSAPTIASQSPTEIKKRRLFAVVAGTSDYALPSLHLTFPARDAATFAKALQLGAQDDPLIERPDITLLASGPGTPDGAKPATKANLEAAFAQIIAQKPTPDDILVVYLSGHGVAIPLDNSTYCYLAQNANSADPSTFANDATLRQATTVTSSEMAGWMGRIGATYRVVILDTCAAGAAGKVFMEKRAVPGDQIRAMKRFQATEGCHVLMGCASDKVSYESSQYGQGLLTYALLQGMKGPALRENSWIDVRSLFGYVEETVPKIAGDIGGIQQPAYQKPDAGSFDIGKLTESDRAGIPLAAARPQILRPRLGNKVDFFDDLGLEALVRARLGDMDAYAARGAGPAADMASGSSTGAGAAFVYVDADQLTGAIQTSGQYEENGDAVTVTLTLRRDGKILGVPVSVAGRRATDAEREALAAKVAAAIAAAACR